ncbi:MAG: creatinine amidohydrolase [Solirubrobacteraceae bacterium]|jgi:creatinine amidohydrolase|nr:creatinine amidohydrolase [Solirubrobacteraceae bacterium]
MGESRAQLMEEMTWPEVRAAAAAGLPVVLPVGSTEQHGPHLPLNTDCEIPQAIALGAGDGYPLIVAPPVRFGAKSRPLSGGGESFPGTLSVRATTLLAVLEDVVSGLARAGFRNICVLNWHWENATYLWEACDLASARHPEARFLIFDQAVPELTETDIGEIFGGDFGGWDVEHAALAETSMMLAIRPELVRTDKLADDRAARNPGWEVIPAPADTIPESGVLWRASKSNQAAGRRLLELATSHLRRALETEFGAPGGG